jgi:hypothetical protein
MPTAAAARANGKKGGRSLEEKFGISIDDRDAQRFVTVGDAIAVVKARTDGSITTSPSRSTRAMAPDHVRRLSCQAGATPGHVCARRPALDMPDNGSGRLAAGLHPTMAAYRA